MWAWGKPHLRVEWKCPHAPHVGRVQQSCHSYPLAIYGITVLWGIMRKAFSTVIPFSCLQAWPEGGQSSPPGAGRASSLPSPLVPWWAPSCSRAAGLRLLPQQEHSVLQMFWRPQFPANLGTSVNHVHITCLHVRTLNQLRAACCKWKRHGGSCATGIVLSPGWHPASCLAREPSHRSAVRDDVRKDREITTRGWSELWVDKLACVYPSCLSKQTAVLLVTRGVCSVQRECRSLSEGFCSGNCKTWVRKGVKWIIYNLDVELICCSQNPVRAHVLPIADISCSFVTCAAMQTLT